ncbi:hypothetical protein [Microcoleus phage My-WqHQDG]|nr:hypothetical protein [Microcoleus phage My-WqHQDG]
MTPKLIAMKLTTGGSFVGTADECLQFLYKHEAMVNDKYALDTNFHWSQTKEQYVAIEGMHPSYIRNVLLQELKTLPSHPGQGFIEEVLSDTTLEHELVGDMYRLWCEMYDVEWNDHRDALLVELVDSTISEELALL